MSYVAHALLLNTTFLYNHCIRLCLEIDTMLSYVRLPSMSSLSVSLLLFIRDDTCKAYSLTCLFTRDSTFLNGHYDASFLSPANRLYDCMWVIAKGLRRQPFPNASALSLVLAGDCPSFGYLPSLVSLETTQLLSALAYCPCSCLYHIAIFQDSTTHSPICQHSLSFLRPSPLVSFTANSPYLLLQTKRSLSRVYGHIQALTIAIIKTLFLSSWPSWQMIPLFQLSRRLPKIT